MPPLPAIVDIVHTFSNHHILKPGRKQNHKTKKNLEPRKTPRAVSQHHQYAKVSKIGLKFKIANGALL